MSIAVVQQRAHAAARAHGAASGVAEAADRGWADATEAAAARAVAARCDESLAAGLRALERDAPAEHAKLVAMLRRAHAARSFEDPRSLARARAWLDAGTPPAHRDAAWVIVWLLGSPTNT